MAVILITHDLTVVRQFSDYVYVMQNGEVKEHNTHRGAVRTIPQHPYTRHLLASEPKGMANPLPDDSAAMLEGKDVRVSFTLKRGGFFKPEFFELVAVDSLEPQAAAARDARPRRRVRLRQDHLRPGADPR